ncbi:hypothetical protein CHS0354_039652 [Potamilus streckersoni]|uniref:Uncharacterized protein n=1 Tax=Potamilus streckersoni TaxID=2493646 RepID=A0AAE0SJH6_9BIVA|nr:hypothetical protein CHS0354_039652 [Potamilus streckersoni]
MVVKVEEKKSVQCTLVGDAMIGKSTMAQSFMDEQHPHGYVATVFDSYAGAHELAGDKFGITIMDSAGQHDYENMRAGTYKESEVLVLCYSCVDRDSFDSIQDFWVPEMKHYMRKRKPVILVATQTDLRENSKKASDACVSYEEGVALAHQIGAESFLECTSMDSKTVTDVFETVITCAVRYRKKKGNIVQRIFGK